MNGALWLIIVLIANVVGLIVYLIVREEKKAEPIRRPTRFCPNCGVELPLDAKFCSHCGKAITD